MRAKRFGQLVMLSLLGGTIASVPATESPAAKNNLVCPTANEADCYPRLFQPTKDFQVIRADQDIPPGLHVRMNIWTGEKEARLNIPMDEEDSISGDAHDAVVVIDSEAQEEDFSEPAMRDRISKKPPAYEAAGKIKPPVPSESGDAATFASALSTLSSAESASYQDALEVLVDLSHDIYFGLEIVKSPEVVQTLFKLMQQSGSQSQQIIAANVVGHSVQNNPTALKELLASWSRTSSESLGSAIHEAIRSAVDAPKLLKAMLLILNGLVKDKATRDSWIQSNGMDTLLQVFEAARLTRDADTQKMSIRLVTFIMDNWLGEEMDPKHGVWEYGSVMHLIGVCDEGVTGRGSCGNCWEKALQGDFFLPDVEGISAEPFVQFNDTLKEVLGTNEHREQPPVTHREL